MNFFKSFWKSITWASVILILSIMNTGNMAESAFFSIPYFDKVVHFSLYMIFTFLVIYELKKSGLPGNSRKVIFISAVTVSFVLGAGMELLQLIPGLHRSAEVADSFANLAGSVSAVIFFRPVNLIAGIILNTGR